MPSFLTRASAAAPATRLHSSRFPPPRRGRPGLIAALTALGALAVLPARPARA